MRGDHPVFVILRALDARHKALPDTGAVRARLHRMRCRFPSVELADHRNPAGVRRPRGERGARGSSFATAIANEMTAHALVEASVRSLTEQVDVVRGKHAEFRCAGVSPCRIATYGVEFEIGGHL